MSGDFDSRKDSHSTKLKQSPQTFVKLTFRELCGSKLSGLHHFDNMVIIAHWANKKYNCSGSSAFKSQRVGYLSNQKLLHHNQH